MLENIRRIFRTVRYLKAIQIYYQIKTRFHTPHPLSYYKKKSGKDPIPYPLNIISLPSQKYTAKKDQTFLYLNLTKTFDKDVDWNFMEYGKLWNYNLQYTDFINQHNLPEEIRIAWLRDLYSCLDSGKLKIEPYPVSLRCMNIIRFLSETNSRASKYEDVYIAVRAEMTYLYSHFEYHLLGNHLLENAFAMLMGGHFFRQEDWVARAETVLKQQLAEQITDDGAHFELSPMYHQIILFRVLESISYLPENNFRIYLKGKCSIMLSWLNNISFNTGEIPNFNDSTNGIAFTTADLLKIAGELGVQPKAGVKLNSSNYRKYSGNNFELVTDIGGISPSYQPGHNHADHLSFVMNAKGRPFVVDPGISTYNISVRRQWERSTKAHNTVTINDIDQSEVWGGFRVGRRAKVTLKEENKYRISVLAKYYGDGLNIQHNRQFCITENMISISDTLNVNKQAVVRFYLHPDIDIKEVLSNNVLFENGLSIAFTNNDNIAVKEYKFSNTYNQLVNSQVIEVTFFHTCQSDIIIN